MAARRARWWAAAGRRTVVALAATLAALCCWAGTAAPASAAPADPPDGLALAAAEACSIPAKHDPAITLAVYGVGRELGVSDKVMLAGFETGWVESHMHNLNCGDEDSLGVFQQRPSQEWGSPSEIRTPRYAARKFFLKAMRLEAGCGSCSAGRIAQDVQISAHGDRYDRAESTVRPLLADAASRYTGRHSIRDVCGPEFRYSDAHELPGATVWLMWDGTSNCVTTIKNSSIGTPTPVRAYVDPVGSSFREDTGSFSYYAGPATLPAPGCIRWGGSVGDQKFDSPLGHC